MRAASALPLLPTTVMGSHPRPSWWHLAAEAMRDGRFGTQDREETLNHAVDVAILDQERAGIDVICDGEMRRLGGYVMSLYAPIEGLRVTPARSRTYGPPHYDQDAQVSVVGRVTAPAGLGIAADFAYLRTRSARPAKATCPGPLTFAGRCELAPPYADMWELAFDLADIVNAELKACVAAGADLVQIDDPWLGIRPGESRAVVELIDRTLAGVQAKTALHICFGNNRGRPRSTDRSYGPLLPAILAARVDQLVLEFANRGMADLDLWQQYRPSQELVAGVVDQKAYDVETPALVAERIRLALQHVPAEKLWLSPDCGFSNTPYWIGIAKMRTLVEGAALVRRELEGS